MKKQSPPSLKKLAEAFKLQNPDASIADFLAFIMDEKQGCIAGKQIALGFWKAGARKGDYHFA